MQSSLGQTRGQTLLEIGDEFPSLQVVLLEDGFDVPGHSQRKTQISTKYNRGIPLYTGAASMPNTIGVAADTQRRNLSELLSQLRWPKKNSKFLSEKVKFDGEFLLKEMNFPFIFLILLFRHTRKRPSPGHRKRQLSRSALRA